MNMEKTSKISLITHAIVAGGCSLVAATVLPSVNSRIDNVVLSAGIVGITAAGTSLAPSLLSTRQWDRRALAIGALTGTVATAIALTTTTSNGVRCEIGTLVGGCVTAVCYRT